MAARVGSDHGAPSDCALPCAQSQASQGSSTRRVPLGESGRGRALARTAHGTADMLTSRGESTANNNNNNNNNGFSAPGRRDHITSTSYSFNQSIPVVRPSGPTSSTNPTTRGLSSASLPSSSAASRDAPKDAHFPKLPSTPSAPQPSSLSSSVVRPSTNSMFPSITPASTSTTSGALPSSTKWGKGNRKLVTAAEVVASRPPENIGPTPEEEAAAKERSELATFAKLVPVASAIPRNPGRTIGFSGGLRDTGSLAAMQQQRAASKSKSPTTGNHHPPLSIAAKDSVSRLRSLSNSKSSVRKGSSTLAPVSNSIVDSSKPTSTRDSRSDETVQPMSVPSEPTEHLLAPRSSGVQLVGSKFIPASAPSSSNPSRPERQHSEPAQPSSELSKLTISSPHTKYSRKLAGADVNNRANRSDATPNGFHSTSEHAGSSIGETKSLLQSSSESLSTQDVRRAPSSRTMNDRHKVANVVGHGGSPGEDVRELRRKAFAASPESKSTRPRNSAYQSTRKQHQNMGRRNQSTSSLDVSFARNNNSMRGEHSQNGIANRSSSFSRGKSTSALEQFGSVESPNFKSRSVANGDGYSHSTIPPGKIRAEALRNPVLPSGKRNTVRKISPGVKNTVHSTQPLPGRWTGLRDAESGFSSQNGVRDATVRDRNSGEMRGESTTTSWLGENVFMPEVFEDRLHVLSNFPHQPVVAQNLDRNAMSSNYTTPWNQLETDFPSRVPNGQEFVHGNRQDSPQNGPVSRIPQGYRKESSGIAERTRQTHLQGQFAMSPIIRTGGDAPGSWMTMVDNAESESINNMLLRNESRLTGLHGGYSHTNGRQFERATPAVASIVGQDHGISTNGSAIEEMRRIQSSARSRLSHAGAAQEYSSLNGSLLHPPGLPLANASAWTAAGPPGFERHNVAQKSNTEFVQPPLPGSHEAGFERSLEIYGYQDDEYGTEGARGITEQVRHNRNPGANHASKAYYPNFA